MSTTEETRATPLVPLLTASAEDAPACADGACSWPGAQSS
ncbi:hypothetical protein J2S61_001352 [Microbacterium barkeri]|nr:hypothetical protein [Microbacterium barkeri]